MAWWAQRWRNALSALASRGETQLFTVGKITGSTPECQVLFLVCSHPPRRTGLHG
jgi:hypothetical protein